jgi:hypothetical protein
MINKLASKNWISVNITGIVLLTLTASPSFATPRIVISEAPLFEEQTISDTNNYSSIYEPTPEHNFFHKSPRLIDSQVTHDNTNSIYSTYYFTIEVPADSHSALKAIKIEQRENRSEKVAFKQNETLASLGDTYHAEQPLSLMAIGGEGDETGSVIVSFEQPIQPGEIVTIGIKPKRNPDQGGVYLFGVTAYPEGESSQGLYLGVGRFHFTHQ